MRWIIALICWLPIGPVPAFVRGADVVIPVEYRVRNQNGNCVWCSAETVFWGGAGHEEFEGITARAIQQGWHGSNMDDVIDDLKFSGIEFKATTSGDYALLREAVANGTGAYIEIDGHSHAVALVGIDADGSARIIDNNGPREQIKKWTASEFKRHWTGTACCPLRNLRRRRNPPPKPEPAPDVKPPEVIPGPPGPAGPPGPPGKDGSNGDVSALKALIAELQKQIEDLKNKPAPQGAAIRVIVSPKKGT